MKVLIYIYHDHKTNNLKTFTADAKFWIEPCKNENKIMFSHILKLYSKNFDCSRIRLKKLISIAKKMKKGREHITILL